MKRLRVRISSPKEKRGSFEGAIRIPLHASLLLFIDLAFLAIPRKSFGFLTLLFSIPTAPTNLFSFQYQDTRRTRGKAKPVTVGTSLMSGESGPKKAQKSLAAEIVAATVGPKLQKLAQRGDLEFRAF